MERISAYIDEGHEPALAVMQFSFILDDLEGVVEDELAK